MVTYILDYVWYLLLGYDLCRTGTMDHILTYRASEWSECIPVIQPHLNSLYPGGAEGKFILVNTDS